MNNIHNNSPVHFIDSVNERPQPANEGQQSRAVVAFNRLLREEPVGDQNTLLKPLPPVSHPGWTASVGIEDRGGALSLQNNPVSQLIPMSPVNTEQQKRCDEAVDDLLTTVGKTQDEPSFCVLPDEILEMIFSCLSSFDDLRASKLVNKRCYRIINNSIVEAAVFYRSRHPIKEKELYASGKRLWDKQSWPDIRNGLKNFNDQGAEAVRTLDKQSEWIHFPELLFFSIAKVRTCAEFFEARNVVTFEFHVKGNYQSDTSAWVAQTRFSPDGNYLAIVTWGKTASIYERADGVWQKKVTISDGERLQMDVIFSPNSRHLVAVCWYAFKIYSLVDGVWQEKNRLKIDSRPRNVSFSFDSKQLLANDDLYGCIKVWGLVGGEWQEKHRFRRRTIMYTASFSPDGNRILTLGRFDGTEIHRFADGAWRQEIKIPCECIETKDATFSPDGCHVVILYYGRFATTYGLVSGQWLKKETTHLYGWPQSVNFGPDGNHVLFSGAGVQIYSFVDGHLHKQSIIKPSAWVGRFSPDGLHFLIANCVDDDRCRVIVYGLVNGEWKEKVSFRHSRKVEDANFSPDGCYIVTASIDQTARIWRLEAREVGSQLSAVGNINS